MFCFGEIAFLRTLGFVFLLGCASTFVVSFVCFVCLLCFLFIYGVRCLPHPLLLVFLFSARPTPCVRTATDCSIHTTVASASITSWFAIERWLFFAGYTTEGLMLRPHWRKTSTMYLSRINLAVFASPCRLGF